MLENERDGSVTVSYGILNKRSGSDTPCPWLLSFRPGFLIECYVAAPFQVRVIEGHQVIVFVLEQ